MAVPRLLLLALALCTHLAAAQSRPVYDVIVIGAGVSGLKAAFDLRQAGRSVLVLEARTRPYGRVDTQQPAGWPLPIELGAQWFHGGPSSNAVLTYARSVRDPSITITSTGDGEDAVTFHTATGKEVGTADEGRWEQWFEQFEEDFLPSQQEADGAEGRSLADAVAAFMASRGINDAFQRRGFLSRIESNYVQEYAANANRLSLSYFNADTEVTGGDSIASNYTSVFSRMVGTLQQSPAALRLGMVVSCVAPLRAATGGAVIGVQVTALNRATQRSETFTARYLLSTLPLGVLKANYGSIFASGVDSAAAARQKAIGALGMGLLNKVIMHFPSAFWTSFDLAGPNQWIATLPLEESSTVQWNEFFSLHKATQQNVLVAFQAGNSAIAAEKLTDVQTITSVMSTLRQMFGNPYLPNPTRYVITRWAQDPCALGAYSFVAVGATDSMRNTLCRASGRVYFSGEACSNTYPSTVQGAWLTGQSAARSIVSVLRSAGGGK